MILVTNRSTMMKTSRSKKEKKIMKIIEKSKLSFEEGYIVSKCEVVGVPDYVVNDLNAIETAIQQAAFLKAQPEGVAAPSLKDFERKSAHTLPTIERPETPLNDKKLADSLALIEELDAADSVEQVNAFITKHANLFEWVGNKKVIDYETTPVKFDLPTLGNPLKLTTKDLTDHLMTLVGTEVDDVLAS